MAADKPALRIGLIGTGSIGRTLDASRTEEPFNLRAGLGVQELVEAIQRSSREGGWKRTA